MAQLSHPLYLRIFNCGNYYILFTRCTNSNQFNILMTAVANVRKGQRDMLYKGEIQTLTKGSIRHQACPGWNCHQIQLESTITMLMSRGRSSCAVTYYVLAFISLINNKTKYMSQHSSIYCSRSLNCTKLTISKYILY